MPLVLQKLSDSDSSCQAKGIKNNCLTKVRQSVSASNAEDAYCKKENIRCFAVFR